MYTVHIESNLASPLAGSATVEIAPRDTVRKVVSDFLFSLEKDDGVPGLVVFDKQYNKLAWDATVESQGVKEGSKLYLVYNKSSIIKPIHIAVVGIAAAIISTILFISVSVLFATTGGDIPFDYGIVIDAGSTHTEVFLYQWSGSKHYGTGEVNQKSSCNIDKGIAEGYDPAEIISCVNNVTRTLPSDNSSPVNLYFGATAGMRLLNETNPLEVNLILTAIKYALRGTAAKEEFIDIIQGDDEGLFSWITTNFLSKSLIQNENNSTYGALDLGGASTQVAFNLDSKSEVNSSDVKVLKLYGQEYNVLSKSFLCFGLTQAAARSKAIIFMKNNDTVIVDPCLPKGYSLKLITKKFLEGSCISNNKTTSWLEVHGNVKELVVKGNSSYKECISTVKNVVNQDVCKKMNFTRCLQNVNLAEHKKKFMAFSSYYYIVNYLSPNGSLEDLIKATEAFCGLSYDEMKKKTEDKKLLSHLLSYCFGAVYVTELLTSVYGFNSSSWEKIVFQQNIKGADVGWSLGLMINATNAIPEESPSPPVVALSAFVPLAIISILMTFFAVLLLQKHFRICGKKQKDLLLESEDI